MTTQGKGLDPHVVPSAIDLHNNNLRLIRMRWMAGGVMLFATIFSAAVLNVPVPTKVREFTAPVYRLAGMAEEKGLKK